MLKWHPFKDKWDAIFLYMSAEYYLRQALELAHIRRGFCSPNPSVGAVIVSPKGEILATGYHLGPGQAHAEVDALNKLNGKADGATIYITLEPCCHFGRTPPCTDAIIASGIKQVVYGFEDPNPIVCGKSRAILAEKNIACEFVTVPEIAEFYQAYSHWQHTNKPLVTAKIALSLDGKIAQENGEPQQITGLALKNLTYQYRKHSDAILTTAKTIICDNPQMNVRGVETISKPIYILDRELRTPLDAKIFSTAKSVTLFYASDIAQEKLERFSQKNIRCIAIDIKQKKLNLTTVIEQIGQDGVHDLWVEAGGICFSECVKQHLLHKILIYIAPRWLGSGLNAFPSDFSLDLSGYTVNWQQVGNDVVCEMIGNQNK